MEGDLKFFVNELSNSRSLKRRRAAKSLRKLGDPVAGPALLEALQKEFEDPRTWETQYQMIMALGECGYREVLPYLEELSKKRLGATTVLTALGDAIVRLSAEAENDVRPVLRLIRDSSEESLLDGAFRAMAMLRMVPTRSDIAEIIDHLNHLPADHYLRFWVAAAAPGWPADLIEDFLVTCENSGRQDLMEAAALARARRYKQWKPL
jgi:HEAT repeat protein